MKKHCKNATDLPMKCFDVDTAEYLSVMGMLPWAYGLIQTKTSSMTLLSVQRQTTLVHKYSLSSLFSVCLG